VLIQGGMTAAQAARLVDEHDTRLWRVLQHYVEKARAEAALLPARRAQARLPERRMPSPLQEALLDADVRQLAAATEDAE